MTEKTLEVISSRVEKLSEKDPAGLSIDDAAQTLLELKRVDKEFQTLKVAKSGWLQHELKKARQVFVGLETLCQQTEKKLKERIVKENHELQKQKELALKKAEESFLKNDLEAVRLFTLKAAECELKLPSGISLRQGLDFEIFDAAAIPRAFLAIDTKKIREKLRAAKEELQIPGIRVTHKITIAAGER